jgi:CheY-like chemotaxis protein
MCTDSSAPKRILVVKENAPARDVLTRLLAEEGFAVQTAADSGAAVEHVRRHGPPSLVLLDGPHGPEFREQQQHDAGLAAVPVLLLADSADGAGPAGPGFLPKPVGLEQLVAEVRWLTRSPRPEILVVEDDDGVRRMLDTVLRMYGFGVRTAATGEAAVDSYRRHQATVAVVLLDVQLPGLDGPEVLTRLQAVNPAVRYCFMSGNTGKYAPEDLRARGAVHVFAKPFRSMAELAQTLRGIVGAGP